MFVEEWGDGMIGRGWICWKLSCQSKTLRLLSSTAQGERANMNWFLPVVSKALTKNSQGRDGTIREKIRKSKQFLLVSFQNSSSTSSLWPEVTYTLGVISQDLRYLGLSSTWGCLVSTGRWLIRKQKKLFKNFCLNQHQMVRSLYRINKCIGTLHYTLLFHWYSSVIWNDVIG